MTGYELAEQSVDIVSKMNLQQYRRVHELLGLPPQRYKGSSFYTFTLPAGLDAAPLLAYLRVERLPHHLETQQRWIP